MPSGSTTQISFEKHISINIFIAIQYLNTSIWYNFNIPLSIVVKPHQFYWTTSGRNCGLAPVAILSDRRDGRLADGVGRVPGFQQLRRCYTFSFMAAVIHFGSRRPLYSGCYYVMSMLSASCGWYLPAPRIPTLRQCIIRDSRYRTSNRFAFNIIRNPC